MTAQEVLNLGFSFLGGGLVTSIINWVRVVRSDKAEKRYSRISSQLNCLYGPLFMLTSRNETLLALSTKVNEAYKIEYIDKEYSVSLGVQESVRRDTRQTIGLSNKYVQLVVENNKKICDLLESQFAHIDPDDVEVFDKFYTHCVRHAIEVSRDGGIDVPFSVFQHLGNIRFREPEFVLRVQERFFKLKSEMARG